jgi:hypothetical protein
MAKGHQYEKVTASDDDDNDGDEEMGITRSSSKVQ